MANNMRILFFGFIILLIACTLNSCSQVENSSTCKQHIIFPAGGYEYPAALTDDDSTLSFYQFRDSLDRRDSFIHAYYGYHSRRSFDEPNLSIRPSPEILFRISYESF